MGAKRLAIVTDAGHGRCLHGEALAQLGAIGWNIDATHGETMNSILSAVGSHTSEHVRDYPRPPALHWAFVLLFHMLTYGIFGAVWMFRQAAWVRHIDPMSNAVLKMSAAFVLPLVVMFGGDSPAWGALRVLANVASVLAFAWAYLSIRRAIEDRFGVSLNIVLTLIFTVLYVQYHLTRIAKSEGALS